MTRGDEDLLDLDIVTPHGVVTRLPTSFPIVDHELDGHLDPDLFQKGFEDANERLCGFPPPWARHHASSTMAVEPDPDDEEPSYTRGYRAALYGYLRHAVD
ncbi:MULTISPECIES: hypothetical protein [Gordonia]|uniref:Uncharacterized protein n=1 Tax=Gordonia tangerina TaxID=2911060 RepID=A0ABS9DNZ9_9ACTN|nr:MULTISPECIES: hypothetical protein [Gordonia]MAU84948.1 hypothetical protein [Gordonia sp. (in: high G+C Gram-positive bacteria)]MCF3939528.1 hypothetical protein [Gordonia tangerina]